ncbi:MAG: TetR/AcrR family transcriptional regulator [Roseburia sp.]|nr:TetR/AcrR family transcriptional regulator [Roseburia sp.]
MEKKATRERILDSALTLFSEKGYDGVGVDLIAEKAELKGPSIYKHFKSKEEILDVLIEKVEGYYEENFGSESHLGEIPFSVEELIDISLRRIQFTLHDDVIKKTRKILAMEQFRSPRIAKLSSRYSMDGIQGMYQKIFRKMMDDGIIKQDDPRMLAMEFAAPVTLLIKMCDREPEREQEAMELIREFLKYFTMKIKK